MTTTLFIICLVLWAIGGMVQSLTYKGGLNFKNFLLGMLYIAGIVGFGVLTTLSIIYFIK